MHEYTAPNVSWDLVNNREKHWNAEEFFRQSIWMTRMSAWRWSFNVRCCRGNKIKSQGDKSGEYDACRRKYSDLMYLRALLWRIMPFAAAHCRAGGTTFLTPTARGDDVQCLRVNVAAHLVDVLVYILIVGPNIFVPSLWSNQQMRRSISMIYWYIPNFSSTCFSNSLPSSGGHSTSEATKPISVLWVYMD
jgi:hypothetical protein